MGDTVWTAKLGGSNQDRAHGVIELNDCSVLICGYTFSTDGDIQSNLGDSDAWLIKLDLNGNIVWSKTYGGSGSEWFNSLIQDDNNDIFIIGASTSNDFNVPNNFGGVDFWIIKIDNAGNILQSENYGGNNLDLGFDIIEFNANYLLIGGTTSSNTNDAIGNHGQDDWLVLKINKSFGAPIWSTCFGGSLDDIMEKKIIA